MNPDANAEYAPTDDRAGVGVRVLAFAIDSAVLFGVTMLFAAVAGGIILVGSDSGRSNVTDNQEWAMVTILLATLPAWYVASVLFVARKGATIGQYVMGLGILDAQDEAPKLKRVALYWLALHPLFFHPVLAVPWFLFGWLTVSLAENEVVFTLCLAISFASLLGPFVNFAFILADPERRGVHDRLVGLRVVHL
jgi:uncharacterized RDD family membrane protein YckC